MTGCFYYNESSYLQEEVSISSRQISDIAANYQKVVPLSVDFMIYLEYGNYNGSRVCPRRPSQDIRPVTIQLRWFKW